MGSDGRQGQQRARSLRLKAEQPEAQAQEKKDPPKDFTNSIGMKFVWIPPGSFMMGSPKEEKERRIDDETQHKVTLTKGFYMGVYTVTQEQWQEVMGNNPSQFKGEKNLPVEKVSWDDCQEFIKKLREKGQEAVSPADRSRVGICLPCWDDNAVSLWRNHFHRPGQLQWQCRLWQRQERRVSEEDHAGRQFPSQCLGAS